MIIITVLLVGADQLGNIPRELHEQGCEKIIHWSGRKKKSTNKMIPGKVDMVIVFSDFVNHNLMGSIREQAKNLQLPIIYSKRGTASLQKTLSNKASSKKASKSKANV